MRERTAKYLYAPNPTSTGSVPGGAIIQLAKNYGIGVGINMKVQYSDGPSYKIVTNARLTEVLSLSTRTWIKNISFRMQVQASCAKILEQLGITSPTLNTVILINEPLTHDFNDLLKLLGSTLTIRVQIKAVYVLNRRAVPIAAFVSGERRLLQSR